MKNCFIVIPAFNEAESLPGLFEVLERLLSDSREYKKLLVLVDDGSTDTTRQFLESYQGALPFKVIIQPSNLGVAAAFRSGFENVLREANEGDLLLTMEADLTSDVELVPAMLRKIEEGADMVLASCYAEGGGIKGTNLVRVFLSRTANSMISAVAPYAPWKTYSSFFRLMRVSLLSAAVKKYGTSLIEQNGFVCMVELLLKLGTISPKVSEVPMLLQIDMRKGKSKMPVMKTIRGYLRFVFSDLILNRKAYRPSWQA